MGLSIDFRFVHCFELPQSDHRAVAVYDAVSLQNGVRSWSVGTYIQVCHPFPQELHRNIGRFGLVSSLLHSAHVNRLVADDILVGGSDVVRL